MCLYQPPSTPGIVMQVGGSLDPHYNFEWLQVISAASVSTSSSGASCTISVAGLDGGEAMPSDPNFPDTFGVSDSPDSPLPQHSGDQEQTEAMAASTFLMFKPDVLSDYEFSEYAIWVPIWRVDWFWSGDAYLFGDGWSIIGSEPPPGGAVVRPTQTSGYPAWGAPVFPAPPCTELPALSGLAITSPVASGANAAITVTLSGSAPSGGAAVTLSGGAAFSTPATCTVPAGASSQVCSGTAGIVTRSTQATVTATYNNSSQSATVTVTPRL